jgi:5,10-methylene-tetrahydrofolate dehydrogenase/methenyl tetrahydrofolate cyclohydrolase
MKCVKQTNNLIDFSHKILSGTKLASLIKTKLSTEVKYLIQKYPKLSPPFLQVIQIGNKKDSNLYIENKLKMCRELGFNYNLLKFDENTSFEELEKCIKICNDNEKINGIIVQLPLPQHLRDYKLKIVEKVYRFKDIDGLNPTNIGNVMTTKIEDDSHKINFMSTTVLDNEIFSCAPPTSIGVVELIRLALYYNNDLEKYNKDYLNKLIKEDSYYDIEFNLNYTKSVVLGRSIVAGQPISCQLNLLGSTVSVCHSKTNPSTIKDLCKNADIIVSAVGKPNLIDFEMIENPNTTIIDVGINVTEDYEGKRRVVGDTDFNGIIVNNKCKYITPVPNGVGKMTVVMLLNNLVRAWKYQNKIKNDL